MYAGSLPISARCSSICSLLSNPQRWLPETNSRQPFSSVESSMAAQAVTRSIG